MSKAFADAPFYLPSDYRDRTRSKTEGIATTGQVSKKGTVTHVEHWDGRVDARVAPAPLALKLTQADGAPISRILIAAIGRHQSAIDELKLARASGVSEWISACEARVRIAKVEIVELQ